MKASGKEVVFDLHKKIIKDSAQPNTEAKTEAIEDLGDAKQFTPKPLLE